MNISKLASTVIMATGIATLLLFAFIFYLYGGDQKVLEKAFTTTSSFFGGIATLVAAYIGTQLFNDWRDQVKDKRNEYFILKYLEYLDYMYQLLVNLTFSDRDFEDKELFNAKIRYVINNLTTQHTEAGTRLKAIAQDSKLDVLIDKESRDRQTLMVKYLEDIQSVSKKRQTYPNAIKDTLDLYSEQNSLTSIYRKVTSKEVSEYCLKKLISFD